MQNILFDFDGTLANSGATVALATQAAFRDLSLPEPSHDTIAYYMGIPIETSFKAMAPEHDFTTAEYDRLLSSFRENAQSLERTQVTLFPDISAVLTHLKQAGRQLFIVTSKPTHTLNRNLKRLNIAHFFTDCIGSDQVTHYKPAPDGILILLDRYHLDPKQTVMVGDATHDLQMGKAAGVKTAAVTWGAHTTAALQSENPDWLCQTALELTQL